MINCVVVFGGESCEHDVSIVTGVQVISKLNAYLYNIIPIYIDKNGVWWTGESLKDIDNFPDNLGKLKRVGFVAGDNRIFIEKSKKYISDVEVDLAFLCLHGKNGEDGSVASVFELSKISYTSAGLMASSLCLDKSIFKIFCKGANVNVVDGFFVDWLEFNEKLELVKEKILEFGLPVILKPARQGSSVGIEVCYDENAIISLLSAAFKYDDRVVVEKYVDIDKEINIALFDNKGTLVFSQTEEPKYDDEILSFEDKYLRNADGFEGIGRVLPARVSVEMEEKIKNISGGLYRALKLFGVVRFDFILSKSGDLYVNEVNTIPGSMANYLFDKITFTELLELLKSNGVYRFEDEKRLSTNYESKFLKSGKNFIKK